MRLSRDDFGKTIGAEEKLDPSMDGGASTPSVAPGLTHAQPAELDAAISCIASDDRHAIQWCHALLNCLPSKQAGL